MPIPTPNKGENKQDFISRCIPIVLEDKTAKDQDQAVAICNSLWDQSKKSKDEKDDDEEETNAMDDETQVSTASSEDTLFQEDIIHQKFSEKDEKIQSLKGVLEKAGLHPSQDLMDKIVGSLKGKSIEKVKLKVSNKNKEEKKKNK